MQWSFVLLKFFTTQVQHSKPLAPTFETQFPTCSVGEAILLVSGVHGLHNNAILWVANVFDEWCTMTTLEYKLI